MTMNNKILTIHPSDGNAPFFVRDVYDIAVDKEVTIVTEYYEPDNEERVRMIINNDYINYIDITNTNG